ncbi:MAG: esterase-like activity of phytase family protein [Cyanobacteria bacterium P01_F01_bin.42]
MRQIVAFCCLIPLLTGCAASQISVEARTYLNLSLEYLDAYELPQTEIDGLSVGGISGLAYDRQNSSYWAIADAKDNPRVFELKITLDQSEPQPKFDIVSVEQLTPLATPTEDGRAIALDPEGIALGADRKWYFASEGLGTQNPPLLGQFEPQSGEWIGSIPVPEHYLPAFSEEDASEQIGGIYPNLAFESLAISGEGDRLFAATEAPLVQDAHPNSDEPQSWVRFLHYWIGVGDPYVVAEHIYPLDPPPLGSLFNGLSEILFVDGGGHFISMERAINPLTNAYQVKLYQLAIASANDVIGIDAIPENLGGVTPIQKQLLFDLSDLDIELANLEGMAFGPDFVDGSQSLILVSDNGFRESQATQFLLFKLSQLPQLAR